MNNHKFYRVKEKTDNNGKTVFKVEAADNKIDVIFNCWVRYTYENQTLKEAIEHIEMLNGLKIKNEKIVYKKTVYT